MASILVKPKDIKFEDLVTDLSCHPSKDVIASGSITGQVSLHAYSSDSESRLLLDLAHHKKSCRCVKFSRDGEVLYTASKDQSVSCIDLNTGSIIHTHLNAHESAIYSMSLVGECLLATGDDDGLIKVWDTRTHTCVMEERCTEEYVSDIAADSDAKVLLATSEDGTLTAYNLRKCRLIMQSETCNSELLSLSIMKNKTKVVCGTGNKALNIFTWGEWNDMSDRFPGFRGSVDCVAPLTDDVLCAGSSDGTIRVVNILPNRFLGVVGRHEGFPVEKISVSHDKKLLASCSHDQTIKFWDLSSVSNEGVAAKDKANRRQKNRNLSARQEDDFFFDLKRDEEESQGKNEEKDDDDEEGVNDDKDESDSCDDSLDSEDDGSERDDGCDASSDTDGPQGELDDGGAS